MILTDKAIEGFKKYLERTVEYAQYKIGNTYYKTPIHRKERMADGRVAIYFSIVPQTSSTVTISEVRIYDNNNDLWARKEENIIIRSVQEGALYRFAFKIEEV